MKIVLIISLISISILSFLLYQKLPFFSSRTTHIEITDHGFSPNQISIQQGTTVVWKNKSGGPATVDSDPHPIHSSYPPLNLGSIQDAETKEFTFQDKGAYNYHDHYHPERKGTITVK